jgi:hypothetical protein
MLPQLSVGSTLEVTLLLPGSFHAATAAQRVYMTSAADPAADVLQPVQAAAR